MAGQEGVDRTEVDMNQFAIGGSSRGVPITPQTTSLEQSEMGETLTVALIKDQSDDEVFEIPVAGDSEEGSVSSSASAPSSQQDHTRRIKWGESSKREAAPEGNTSPIRGGATDSNSDEELPEIQTIYKKSSGASIKREKLSRDSRDDVCTESSGVESTIIVDDISPMASQNSLSEDKLCEYPIANEKVKTVTVKIEDFITLQKDTFLNDIILDFFLAHLFLNDLSNEFRESTHIFNTMFYKRLVQVPKKNAKKVAPYETDSTLSTTDKQYLRVEGWTKNVNLFSKSMLLFPICENSHWYLIVVIFPGSIYIPLSADTVDMEPRLLVLDSLGGTQHKAVSNIQKYLESEWRTKYCLRDQPQFITKRMNVFRPEKPEQKNGYDCGIFLLHYVEKIFRRMLDFLSPDLPNLSKWFTQEEVGKKRGDIQLLIRTLSEQQKEVGENGLEEKILKYQKSNNGKVTDVLENKNIIEDNNDKDDMDSENLQKKTVPELRQILREKGLQVSGNKNILLKRLESNKNTPKTESKPKIQMKNSEKKKVPLLPLTLSSEISMKKLKSPKVVAKNPVKVSFSASSSTLTEAVDPVPVTTKTLAASGLRRNFRTPVAAATAAQPAFRAAASVAPGLRLNLGTPVVAATSAQPAFGGAAPVTPGLSLNLRTPVAAATSAQPAFGGAAPVAPGLRLNLGTPLAAATSAQPAFGGAAPVAPGLRLNLGTPVAAATSAQPAFGGAAPVAPGLRLNFGTPVAAATSAQLAFGGAAPVTSGLQLNFETPVAAATAAELAFRATVTSDAAPVLPHSPVSPSFQQQPSPSFKRSPVSEAMPSQPLKAIRAVQSLSTPVSKAVPLKVSPSNKKRPLTSVSCQSPQTSKYLKRAIATNISERQSAPLQNHEDLQQPSDCNRSLPIQPLPRSGFEQKFTTNLGRKDSRVMSAREDRLTCTLLGGVSGDTHTQPGAELSLGRQRKTLTGSGRWAWEETVPSINKPPLAAVTIRPPSIAALQTGTSQPPLQGGTIQPPSVATTFKLPPISAVFQPPPQAGTAQPSPPAATMKLPPISSTVAPPYVFDFNKMPLASKVILELPSPLDTGAEYIEMEPGEVQEAYQEEVTNSKVPGTIDKLIPKLITKISKYLKEENTEEFIPWSELEQLDAIKKLTLNGNIIRLAIEESSSFESTDEGVRLIEMQTNLEECGVGNCQKMMTQGKIEAHRATHKKFECPHCEKELSSKQMLLSHIKTKHNESADLRCEKCEFIAPTESKLKSHKNQHHEKIACPICETIFESKVQLRAHRKNIRNCN